MVPSVPLPSAADRNGPQRVPASPQLRRPRQSQHPASGSNPESPAPRQRPGGRPRGRSSPGLACSGTVVVLAVRAFRCPLSRRLQLPPVGVQCSLIAPSPSYPALGGIIAHMFESNETGAAPKACPAGGEELSAGRLARARAACGTELSVTGALAVALCSCLPSGACRVVPERRRVRLAAPLFKKARTPWGPNMTCAQQGHLFLCLRTPSRS